MSETTTPAAAEVPAWVMRAELLTIDWCQQRLYARLIDEWTAASCRTARRTQFEAKIARCEEARRFLDRLWRETDLLPGIPEPTNAGTWFA